ncbi:hypothetical protein ACWKWU_15925 [Chitinophaga lutea]
MSSKQINFFITNDDLLSVVNFFKNNDCILVQNEVDKVNNNYDDIDRILARGKKAFQVYLTHPGVSDIVNYRQFEENHYYVDIVRSNVLEFGFGGMYENDLRRSRFYFVTSFFQDADSIKKTPDFTKWADSLMKRFRKEFLIKSDFNTSSLFSPAAIKWAEVQGAELREGGQKLVANIAK